MENEASLMPVVCAWCGHLIESKPGPLNGISHGVCKTCLERELAKLEAEDKEPDNAG